MSSFFSKLVFYLLILILFVLPVAGCSKQNNTSQYSTASNSIIQESDLNPEIDTTQWNDISEDSDITKENTTTEDIDITNGSDTTKENDTNRENDATKENYTTKENIPIKDNPNPESDHTQDISTELPTQISTPPTGLSVQLFTDPKIEKGFNVYPLDSAQGMTIIKTFPGILSGTPEWGLVQWFSRFNISTVTPASFEGGRTYQNEGKSFTLSPASSSRGEIYLQVNGSNEYAHHRLPGEVWPHLYINKDFSNGLQFLKDISALDLSLKTRLGFDTVDWMGNAANASLHTAQFLAIFTVQDRNRGSAGFGDYYWFNVPIYDNRPRINDNDIIMRDEITSKPDATGKLIYIPKYPHFACEKVNVNDWVTIKADLLPLMEYGFNEAKTRGYMKNSTYNDLAVGMTVIGWEVTGTYDCAMMMKDISLIAHRKN